MAKQTIKKTTETKRTSVTIKPKKQFSSAKKSEKTLPPRDKNGRFK